jgi:RNA polymerase sigma-70 factor, ECF subfamily
VYAVEQGLRELPPDLREVVVLCEFEEMRYEDVAMALELPVGTVRSRLHRAKRRLALLLTNEVGRPKVEERS